MTMVEDMERLEKKQQSQHKILISILSRLEEFEENLDTLNAIEIKKHEGTFPCITSGVKGARTQQKHWMTTAWTAVKKWWS